MEDRAELRPRRAQAPKREEPRDSRGSLGTAMETLESLAHQDPGGRGLSSRIPAGGLGPAAFSLLAGRRVVILTGFCIRSALAGETDGPPGALALAGALRVLGKRVMLVSDRYSLPLLRAGAKAAGPSFRALELPCEQSEADDVLDSLVASYKPTHVVAIERPGSASDGHRYSMRGAILDDIAPGADRLFTNRDKSYVTLAIGDGGNELGMGSLRESCMAYVSLGQKIFCSSPADHALVAGISNWGAYALVSALSLLSGVLLLGTVEREREVLSAMIEAGAVDGCTGRSSFSVDELEGDEYFRTFAKMRELTQAALAEGSGRNA